MRLPSAFAGWLCIPAIYLLGKRLYSEREGIFSMRMSPGCLANRRRSRRAEVLTSEGLKGQSVLPC